MRPPIRHRKPSAEWECARATARALIACWASVDTGALQSLTSPTELRAARRAQPLIEGRFRLRGTEMRLVFQEQPAPTQLVWNADDCRTATLLYEQDGRWTVWQPDSREERRRWKAAARWAAAWGGRRAGLRSTGAWQRIAAAWTAWRRRRDGRRHATSHHRGGAPYLRLGWTVADPDEHGLIEPDTAVTMEHGKRRLRAIALDGTLQRERPAPAS
ncbi:MAG: hypothetical protein F4X35_02510 [Alphaproteobacteria bacterium]|nr:hypothetical protein [Alphaproteobacteria bacterium]